MIVKNISSRLKFTTRRKLTLVIILVQLMVLSCSETDSTEKEINRVEKTDAATLEEAKNHFYSGEKTEAIALLKTIKSNLDGEVDYFMGLSIINSPPKQSYEKIAFTHFVNASDLGHPLAMHEVGRSYEGGIGVDRDILKSIDWYRKSEKLESSKSTLDIIRFQEVNGELAKQSISDHLSAIQSQAKAGDIDAQLSLAKMYDIGAAVQEDHHKMLYWYTVSAKNGNQHAQLMLGYFYCKGGSITKNIELAKKWLKKSERNVECNN